MAVRRSLFYVGAGGACKPEDLDAMEATGLYVGEPKWDGMFASLHVAGEIGGTNLMRSRDTAEGRAFVPGDERYSGIDKLALPGPGTVVMGELEAATEHATAVAKQRGYRKFYAYDMIESEGGEDMRDWPWELRREALEEWHRSLSPEAQKQIELSPVFHGKFKQMFDLIRSHKGEGLVLKRKDSTLRVGCLDGKIDTWLKCKIEETFDYVLIGSELTKKLQKPTGQLGLWDAKLGTFRKCLTCSVPPSLLKPEHFGKVVVEVVAFCRFKSGAARSARFVRVRTDREPKLVTANQVG